MASSGINLKMKFFFGGKIRGRGCMPEHGETLFITLQNHQYSNSTFLLCLRNFNFLITNLFMIYIFQLATEIIVTCF